jgi:hypothetical protein
MDATGAPATEAHCRGISSVTIAQATQTLHPIFHMPRLRLFSSSAPPGLPLPPLSADYPGGSVPLRHQGALGIIVRCPRTVRIGA